MPANRSRTERWRECLDQIYERSGGLELSLDRHGMADAGTGGAPTDLIYANMPDYLLQLGTDYQLSGALAPLSVGGNLTWQSAIEGFNIPHPSGTVTVKQSPKAILNLRASWQFNPKLSATLAVNNVTDQKYWANLDYGNYADPRNVSVTLRAAF